MSLLIKTQHEVRIPPDDGQPTIFCWHFTRGMLAPRMSGLELAQFIIRHMPAVLPFFSNHPKVYSDFAELLRRFSTLGAQVLDEVLPWVQSVCREGPDDIIILTLNPKHQRDTRRRKAVFY